MRPIRRLLLTTATVVGVVAISASAAFASGNPTYNVSFMGEYGGIATWVPGHAAIRMYLPASRADAIITLHHFTSVAPAEAPTFATTTYQSGSPRWYIQFSAPKTKPS